MTCNTLPQQHAAAAINRPFHTQPRATHKTMSTSTTNLRLAYTAPGSPELGQQTVAVTMGGLTPALQAVCNTEIVLDHPPGQRLRLVSPTLQADSTDPHLSILLPADEQVLDLTIVAMPSGTAIRITVTTKKEGSKPDQPRSALFSP